MQGGYWEAKAAHAFKQKHLTDIYDITPVASKDPEAAEAYQRIMPAEYKGRGATGA